MNELVLASKAPEISKWFSSVGVITQSWAMRTFQLSAIW
jgi:hypothetical protein